MSHVAFRGRPSPPANETRFAATSRPAARSTSPSTSKAATTTRSRTRARSVDGNDAIELIDCLGLMLPVEEFDSPAELAARLEVLRGSTPGAFHGVPTPRMVREGFEAGKSATRRCTYPPPRRSSAIISRVDRSFRDAPARCQIGLAMKWPARPRTGSRIRTWAGGMTHVKMRSFIPPGATLGIEVAMTTDAASATFASRRGWTKDRPRTPRRRGEEHLVTTAKRVAITGIGLVTPVGNDVASTWDALLAGRSGGAPIAGFDASGFPVRIAAEVKGFDAESLLGDRKLLKFTTNSHRFALVAAEQAFRDAGIRPTAETATRWGCAVGAGMMTSEYVDLATTHAHSAADGQLHADRMLTDPSANDPMVFCRSQATAGISFASPGSTASAVTRHRCNTACASRPGARHRAQIDPSRRGRLCARRRLRTR
jgi:hypothetical protein